MPRFRAILLPGGVLPADLAYGGLVAALGPDVDVRSRTSSCIGTTTPR